MTRIIPIDSGGERIARIAGAAGALAVCAAVLAFQPAHVVVWPALELLAQGPGFPGGGGRGGFGGVQRDREVVAQLDTNGDKRLDTHERKAARDWLATQPTFGPGGRGGRFGNSSTPPAPGRK